MLVTRTSPLTGTTRTVVLPITDAQYARWLDGALIQDAFPQLSAEDREFFKSGITGDEWNSLFASAE